MKLLLLALLALSLKGQTQLDLTKQVKGLLCPAYRITTTGLVCVLAAPLDPFAYGAVIYEGVITPVKVRAFGRVKDLVCTMDTDVSDCTAGAPKNAVSYYAYYADEPPPENWKSLLVLPMS